MIGKEDTANEEESVLKVLDKRKFNVDGSLREGVTLESAAPKEDVKAPSGESPIVTSEAGTPASVDLVDSQSAPIAESVRDAEDEISEEDLLNDQNPASFVNFLSTLVTNAAASLGAMPHPVTGQKNVDLDTGKYWIDVMLMLREKTSGNLARQEKQLMDSILHDLQLQYLALTKATEEKLKAQAAKKFSSKDILGG